jgi:hypothetical protein
MLKYIKISEIVFTTDLSICDKPSKLVTISSTIRPIFFSPVDFIFKRTILNKILLGIVKARKVITVAPIKEITFEILVNMYEI